MDEPIKSIAELSALADKAHADTKHRYNQRIAELEARTAALEAMLRAAGYSEPQIAAGSPYVEAMGN